MNSSYVHTKPQAITPQLSGLAGLASENWLIDSYYNKLKITGKNDAYPFSIDVEIYTDSTENWFQLTCPDLFVMVRSAANNKIYASKYITTHRDWQSCSGESTIIFDTSFSGNKNELLKIEIYNDNVETRAAAQNSYPLAVSPAFKLSNDSIYNNPSQDEGGSFFSADTGTVLKYGTILLGAGAAAYFIAPFAPVLKNGFENIAQKFKSDNPNE